MRSGFRKFGIATVAAVSVLGAMLVTSGSAEARYRHWHGGGWGWGGPAFVGGLAFGALAAPAFVGGYPAYGYYDGGCGLRREVVGYTRSGRPIVRRVRVCY